jgi:hypothetical protein
LLTGYDNWSSSLFKNIRIVKDLDIVFDFAFIDGDHCRQSLLNDIELCSQVVQYPHYMLIDDVDDPRHDSTAVFHNELVKDTYHWDTYDYSDWTIKTGIGLLWQQ